MSDARQWVIGRAPDCDIVLSSSDVSGRHARLTFDGSRWLLEDLGSANGTYLNGRRIPSGRATPLTPQDIVLVASASLPWPSLPKRVSSRAIPFLSGGVALIAVLIAFVWIFRETEPNHPAESPPDSEPLPSSRLPDPPTPAKGVVLEENFVDSHANRLEAPLGWKVAQLSIQNDVGQRPFLAPVRGQKLGTAFLPIVEPLTGEFTIEGEALCLPTFSIILEGTGPRTSVTIDSNGQVKLNNDPLTRPEGKAAQKKSRESGPLHSFQLVKRGSTLSVSVDGKRLAAQERGEKMDVGRIQVVLTGMGPTRTSRLYAIRIVRD